MKHAIYLFTFVIMIGTSCKKNNQDPPPVLKDVYILTNERGDAPNDRGIIKYFKNGVMVDSIGDGATVQLYGQDMDVSGSDVYILATRIEQGATSQEYVIYKNGVQVQTIPASNSFYPNCIAVSNADIYLSGTGSDSVSLWKVKLWKNGALSDVSDGTVSAACWDMLVNGSDVYVGGFELRTTGKVACYWKNGARVTVGDGVQGNRSEVHRIAVSGSDVYTAGFSHSKAVLWKNTVASELSSNDGFAFGVATNGADVYAGGTFSVGSSGRSGSWKNGTLTYISNSANLSSIVFGIAVDNVNVYVIGNIQASSGSPVHAVYWKNGVETILTSNRYAEAYRIVVK